MTLDLREITLHARDGSLDELWQSTVLALVGEVETSRQKLEQLAGDNNALRANSYNGKLERLTKRLEEIEAASSASAEPLEPGDDMGTYHLGKLRVVQELLKELQS